MSNASRGRRRRTKGGVRAAIPLEQGLLWGELMPVAHVAIEAAHDRRAGVGTLRDTCTGGQGPAVVSGGDRQVGQASRSVTYRPGLRKGDSPRAEEVTPESALAALQKRVEMVLRQGDARDDVGHDPGESGQAQERLQNGAPVGDAGERSAGALYRVESQPAAPPAGELPESLRLESGRLVHDFNNTLTVLLANLSLAAEEVRGPATELLLSAQDAALLAKELTEDLPRRIHAAAAAAQPLAEVRFESAKVASWSISSAAHRTAPELDPALLWRLMLRIWQVVMGLAETATGVSIDADVVHEKQPAEIEVVIGWRGGCEVRDAEALDAHGRLQRSLTSLGGGTTLTSSAGAAELRLSLPLRSDLPAGGGGSRILLMDDEQAVRQAAARILAAADYDVSQAASGRAALALFRRARQACRPFQLALLDLNVPEGMDGEETGRQLLAIDPELPILISTGRMSGLVEQDWQRLGFCGVVPKPYTANALRSSVKRALRLSGETSA